MNCVRAGGERRVAGGGVAGGQCNLSSVFVRRYPTARRAKANKARVVDHDGSGEEGGP